VAILVALNTLSIKEYDDGMVTIQWGRQDPKTRRMTWADPFRYAQSLECPLTIPELALMAAAERVAGELGYAPELPF
jgi:hypothetical protein